MKKSLAVQKQIVWFPYGTPGKDPGKEFLILGPSVPSAPDWFQLVQKSRSALQSEAYSTFSSMLHWPENVVIPLEGVLVVLMSIMIWKHLQSGLEFIKLWRKIPTLVLVLVEARASPLKENKTTHYAAYFTTCTLTRTEGKVVGPIHVSNILKRTFIMKKKNLHI